MVFDDNLDLMLRAITEKEGMVRKKMFGGTCYLLDNKMVSEKHSTVPAKP